MNEIENIINNKPNLSKNTIRTYTTSYNKLKNILATDNVAEIDNDEIIELVGDEKNYGSQNLLLTIAMMIKHEADEDYDKIKKHRELVRGLSREYKIKIKDEKKDSLPEIKDLKKHLNKLYAEEQYRAFIINFLLIHFNVRNLDLDIIMTDNLKDYRKAGKSGQENVILAGKNHMVYYYRNNYKTKSTYGEKTIKLSNVKLSRAIKGYISQKQINDDPVYLLALENGERINRESLSHYIPKYTHNNLTETDYNKIIVTGTVKSMSDYDKLEKISNNRGTAIPTLIEEYNLDVKI